MSDPFELLTPKSGGGRIWSAEVRYHQHDAIFHAWKAYNIAYPQLYVIQRDSPIPEPILDDGKPLTHERLKELMRGIRPMFTTVMRDGEPVIEPTNECYVHAFDDRIDPEPFGASAVAYRPKHPRYFHPIEIELEKPDGQRDGSSQQHE